MFSEWACLNWKILVDLVVTCLAYIEFPNSILSKNPKIGRIILIFPDSPDSHAAGSQPMLASVACLCSYWSPLKLEKATVSWPNAAHWSPLKPTEAHWSPLRAQRMTAAQADPKQTSPQAAQADPKQPKQTPRETNIAAAQGTPNRGKGGKSVNLIKFDQCLFFFYKNWVGGL